MKIIDLESPYKELAIKRCLEAGISIKQINEGLDLYNSFDWWYSSEGYDFWSLVNINEKPPIKDTKLLAELTKVDTITTEIIDILYDMGYIIEGDKVLDEIKKTLKKHI